MLGPRKFSTYAHSLRIVIPIFHTELTALAETKALGRNPLNCHKVDGRHSTRQIITLANLIRSSDKT